MYADEQNDKELVEYYNKYAPKNLTFNQFKKMVEQNPNFLDLGGGNFSTVSPELSIAFKKYKNKEITDDEFRNILKNSMNQESMENISQNYAKTYENIICSDDDILRSAWAFKVLNRKQKQDLAVKIIDGINKHFGIENKLKITYADKKTHLPFKELITSAVVNLVLTICEKKEKAEYQKEYSGYYNNFSNSIVILKTDDFARFMEILSHEYGHFIDKKYPDLGMLGAQISFYGREVSSSRTDNNAYKTNPSEVSSYKIGAVVSQHIEQVLKEQALKKPVLYAEALEILIGYTKTKIAGMRMKYNNIFKKVGQAEKEYDELKNKLLKELYPEIDIENVSIEQAIAAVQKLETNPKVKDAKKKYEQIRSEIPKEYGELQGELFEYTELMNACNSNQERLFSALKMYDM